MNRVSKKSKKGHRYAKSRTKKLNIKKLLVFGIIIILCITFSSTVKMMNRSKSDKFLASMSKQIDDIEANYDKTAGQKAIVKSIEIAERKTGEGVFDDDNDAGNDENDTNNIIRTLDILKYSIDANIDFKEGITSIDAEEGTLKVEATLDDSCSGKVRWDLPTMTWVNPESIVSDDGLTFVGYYTMKGSNLSVPGTQDLLLVAKVLYAENGFEFKPNFKISLVGNNEDEKQTISDNENIKVSATDKYDMVLTKNLHNYSILVDGQEKRLFSYSFGFKLNGDTVEKGLKGIAKPIGNISFDIDYSLLTQNEDISNYLRFYNYKYNIGSTEVLGDPANSVDDTPSTTWNSWGKFPYSNNTTTNDQRRVVHQNGELKMESNNGNKINVTIKDWNISETFPDRVDQGNYSTDEDYTIQKNEGYISTGIFYLVLDMDDNLYEKYENAEIDVKIENLKIGENITNDILQGNNEVRENVEINPIAKYYKEVDYIKNDFTSLASTYGAGDASLYRNRDFYIYSVAETNQENSAKDWIYGLDSLIKFDDKALKVKTTSSGEEYVLTIDYQQRKDVTCNILYAAKKDGTGWDSDKEMQDTTMYDLKYYNTIEDLENDKMTCVAVLIESEEGYIKSGHIVRVAIPFAVRDDAPVNYVAQALIQTGVYNQEHKPNREVQTHLKTTEESAYEGIVFIGNSKNDNSGYIKSQFDDDGKVKEGTHYPPLEEGDSLKILAGNLGVSIDTIQGNNKTKDTYDIGNSENEIDYKIITDLSKADSSDPDIEGVKVKLTVTLPVGLTYKVGSCNIYEPTISKNEDGTTTLIWQRDDCSTIENISDITFSTYISENTENNHIYTINAKIVEMPGKDGKYKVGNDQRTSTMNANYNITVVNLSSWVFTIKKEQPSIEVGGKLHYILTFCNVSSLDIENFQILDILPYNDDARNSMFSGTYNIDQINVSVQEGDNSKEFEVYVTDDNSVIQDGLTAKDSDLQNKANWELIKQNTTIGKNGKAFMIKGNIKANEVIIVDLYLKTQNNKPLDVYANDAMVGIPSTSSEIKTSTEEISVIDRQIKGKVWFDQNKDGIKNESEKYLEGIELSLVTESGGSVNDVLNEKVNNITTNENGEYMFTKLPQGKYKVKIILDEEDFKLTEKEIGNNTKINSKFNKETKDTDVINLDKADDTIIIEENVNAGLTSDTFSYEDQNIEVQKSVITKDGKTQVKEGDKIQYEIKVTNNENNQKDVLIKDIIPTGTTYVNNSIKLNGKDTNYNQENLKNGIPITLSKQQNMLETMTNPPTRKEIEQNEIADGTFEIVNLIENGQVSNKITSYDSKLMANYNTYISGINMSEDTYNQNLYSMEFSATIKKFAIQFYGGNFRLYVDEGDGYKLVQKEYWTTTTNKWQLIEFNESKKRNIKIELSSAILSTIALDKEGASTLKAVEREKGKTAVFIGDRYTSGQKNTAEVNVWTGESYSNILSNILGFECINAGCFNGSYRKDGMADYQAGYCSGDYQKIIEYTISNFKPDVMFISGGMYDAIAEKTADEIVSSARQYCKYIKENSPETKLIVLGIQFPGENLYLGLKPPAIEEANKLLIQMAKEEQIPYIDLLNGDTYNEQGTKITQGTGAYIKDNYVVQNTLYMTLEGNENVGIQLAEEVRKILGDNYIGGQSEIVLTFEVTINNLEDGTESKDITNIAQVNNKSTNETKITVIKDSSKNYDIEGTKTATVLDNKEIAEEGDTIQYEIKLKNNGDLSGIANLKDVIPSETSFVDESLEIDGKPQTYRKEDLEKGIEVKIPTDVSIDESPITEMEDPPQMAYGSTPYDSNVNIENSKIYWAGNDTIQYFTSYNSNLEGDSGFLGKNLLANTEEWTNSYALEFAIDSKEFSITCYGTFRISVDEGNGYKKVTYNPVGNSEGGQCAKITFKEKKVRNIKIELVSFFVALVTGQNDTLYNIKDSPIHREVNPKIAFIGDSWTAASDIGSFTSYSNILSDILGLEVINEGIGGTGYLTEGSNSNTYYKRLEYVIEKFHPEIIVLSGGGNDVGTNKSVADVVEELKKCCNYVRENAKDSKLIIFGLECPQGSQYLSDAIKNFNTEFRKVALDYNVPYVDFITGETIAGDGTKLSEEKGSYITGNGNVGNKTNNGNADLYIQSDGQHPNMEGHKYLGKKIAVEVAKVLYKYGIKVNNVNLDSQEVSVKFKVTINPTQDTQYEKEISNTAQVNGHNTNTAKVTVRKVSTEHLNTIYISKVDENGNNLSGARLQLLNSENKEIDQWITEDSVHIIENLPDGTYTLKELEAPEGYDIADDISIDVNESQETSNIIMRDKLTKVTIKLTKVDSWNADKLLGGAEFKLVKMKEVNGELVEDESFEPIVATTNTDGILNFTDIVYGTYRLYETKAPEGYNLLNKYVEVNVDNDNVEDKIVNVKVKNTEKFVLPDTGSIGSGLLILIGMWLIGRNLLKRKVMMQQMRNKNRMNISTQKIIRKNKNIIRRKGKHY